MPSHPPKKHKPTMQCSKWMVVAKFKWNTLSHEPLSASYAVQVVLWVSMEEYRRIERLLWQVIVCVKWWEHPFSSQEWERRNQGIEAVGGRSCVPSQKLKRDMQNWQIHVTLKPFLLLFMKGQDAAGRLISICIWVVILTMNTVWHRKSWFKCHQTKWRWLFHMDHLCWMLILQRWHVQISMQPIKRWT